MDMRKYAGDRFVKVEDVRRKPIESQIAVIKEGKYDKPNLVLETGHIVSLNATNSRTLLSAYGSDSDKWIGKTVRLFLGMIQYQGADHEAVLVKPISPADEEEDNSEPAPAPDDGKPYDDPLPF